MAIQTKNLGKLSYDESLLLQEQYHERIRADKSDGIILTVEHLPVITLGKHSNPEFVLKTEDFLKSVGVDVSKTDRGGEATAHELGQLTVYPIIPIEKFGLSPKKYVDIVMYAVQAVLKDLGIQTRLDCEHPGVWVGTNKICAVGARIKKRVSMHGIALNIDNDLKTFSYIIPCGISSRGVTSVSKELGRTISVEELRPLVVGEIIKRIEEFRRV